MSDPRVTSAGERVAPADEDEGGRQPEAVTGRVLAPAPVARPAERGPAERGPAEGRSAERGPAEGRPGRNRSPAVRYERIALVDLLDRLLAGGVVISGEVRLSIADVDLVNVSLRALISSVSSVLEPGREDDS